MRIYGNNWRVMRLSRSGLIIRQDAKNIAGSLLKSENLSLDIGTEYGCLKRIDVVKNGGPHISEKQLARIVSFGLKKFASGVIKRDSSQTIHVGPFRTVKLELKRDGLQNTLSISFLGYSLPIAQLSKAQGIIERQSEELSGLKSRFLDLQTVLEQKEKQGVPKAKLIRFLGQIQHDINNFLCSILTPLQLIQADIQDRSDDRNDRLFKMIEDGSEKIKKFLSKVIQALKDESFVFDEEIDYRILIGLADKINEEIRKGEDQANYQVWIAKSQPKRINIQRILILDDQEEMRKFALEKFDFVANRKAFETSNELLAYLADNEMLEAVKNGEVLISIDYNMPDINGVEAAKAIKAFLQAKSLSDAPLPLILNSNRGSDIEESAQNVGFHGRIDKNGAIEEYYKYLENLQKAWNGV
jgi:CheY-like chemotaxis protein